MNVQETIQYLNDKIGEIETYADMRANDMPKETKDQITAVADRSVTVIKQVITKVEEASAHTSHDANFEGFLQEVVDKCEGAVAYTRTKIDEAVSSSEHTEKLKEAKRQILDSFEELKAHEEVKEMVASIKEVTASIYEHIEDYLSKPETQEAMTKAKISTVKIAEKGVSVLKKFLKVDDEDL